MTEIYIRSSKYTNEFSYCVYMPTWLKHAANKQENVKLWIWEEIKKGNGKLLDFLVKVFEKSWIGYVENDLYKEDLSVIEIVCSAAEWLGPKLPSCHAWAYTKQNRNLCKERLIKWCKDKKLPI